MDLRDVVKSVGFPVFSSGICNWDHGIHVYDTCWHYQSERGQVVENENLIGVIPPQNPSIVHVIFADGRVAKVEVTQGRPPETPKHLHRGRLSIDADTTGRELFAGFAFSPDEAQLAVGDADGQIRLRDSKTGRVTSRLRIAKVAANESAGWINAIRYSPDGKVIAAGGFYDRTIRFVDVASGNLIRTIPVVPGPFSQGSMECVNAIAFGPNGTTLATAGPDSDLRIWETASGRLVGLIHGHDSELTSVAISPDGKTMATGDSDGTFRLWDLTTLQPIASWPGYRDSVNSLVFSPNGKTLAVARHERTVQLVDLATLQTRLELRQTRPVHQQCMTFSPDSAVIAVTGVSDVPSLWSVADGRRIGILEGHEHWPEGIAYSPNGKTIATFSSDGTLKFWDPPSLPKANAKP